MTTQKFHGKPVCQPLNPENVVFGESLVKRVRLRVFAGMSMSEFAWILCVRFLDFIFALVYAMMFFLHRYMCG